MLASHMEQKKNHGWGKGFLASAFDHQPPSLSIAQ